MARKINWGLLATGNIANALANGIQRSKTGCLLAAASRSRKKAQKFAAQYEIPSLFNSRAKFDAGCSDTSRRCGLPFRFAPLLHFVQPLFLRNGLLQGDG